VEIPKLKPAAFGVPANRLTARLSNGETPGTKKIAFEFGETVRTTDNIGRKSLQIRYTGDGDAAVLDVDNGGLSAEITRNDPVPAPDIIGLNGLRVGEAKPFTVHAANPEGAELLVAAKIDVDGIDPAHFQLEYFDIEAGSVRVPVDPATPFRGPAGFVLQTGDLRLRLTPLAGAEGRIMEYGITLLQVVSGAVTTNVTAQTAGGKTEIAAADAPYSGYRLRRFQKLPAKRL
jgi:hypothetical protein